MGRIFCSQNFLERPVKLSLLLLIGLLSLPLLSQEVLAESCKTVSVTITPGGDYRFDYNVTINGIEPRRLKPGIQVGNDSLYEYGVRVCGTAVISWESFVDDYTMNVSLDSKRVWTHEFHKIKFGSKEINLNSI